MDERMLQMFLEEGRLIARLVHPNIVRTLEVGGDAEQDFIAMELMLGKTFAAIQDSVAARDVRLSPDIAAWTAARVADALHYAHELADEAGRPLALVHRDVNPANVFATFAGEVKLFDFGLAKVTAGDASGSHLIAGKLSYLSPEQIMQMPLDRRSDIFSLGTTLWELLTGKRLFRRVSDLDTVRAVQLGPIPDPRAVAPEIPEELARITKTALERNREHRYPTAAYLARELDAFVFTRTSPNDVTSRLAQLVDTLFPGEQKRQSGWMKPAISASIRPSTGPAGPVSMASPRRDMTGRPAPIRRPSPPPRSLSPKETTAVMPHPPPRHDGPASSSPRLPGSSPSLPTSSSPSFPASSPSSSSMPASSPTLPASRPSAPGSMPRIPASRPSIPTSSPSSPAMPISSPVVSAPPDTLPHMFEVTPRDGVPSIDPEDIFVSDPRAIGPVTPIDGTPAIHHRAMAAPPPSIKPPASIPPPSATLAGRPSWPIPTNPAPSVPPPPQRNRAPGSLREPPREVPVRPSRGPSIPPPPPSSPTELSAIAPVSASRTEIQTMPEAPAQAAPEGRKRELPIREVEPTAPTPSNARAPGAPGSLFSRPKRAPVPLPSRLKGAEAAKKTEAAPSPSISPSPSPSKKPAAPPTPATITKPPDSDTQVDVPAPPPGKRS
jgi:eukaryotic-like serine/threonine-protein kinase